MLRIVIVDDEYYFRNALKANMPWAENDMTVVGDANDGPGRTLIDPFRKAGCGDCGYQHAHCSAAWI